MITDLNKFIRFLQKYGISAHEFMLPYMLYLDERVKRGDKEVYPNSGSAIANLFKYKEASRGWTLTELERLVDKGLLKEIKKVNTKNQQVIIPPELLEPTEEFCSQIFAPETRFEEFQEAYPVTIPNFNNPRRGDIPLQIVDDMEALEHLYNAIVKTNVLHNKIINIVEWAKEKGILTVNIRNFVASRHWETLEKQKQKYLDMTEGYVLKRP